MPEPTDDEIRRVLAEKVMGWTWYDALKAYGPYRGSLDETICFRDWDPLRNIEQAMMCAEKLSEMGMEYEDKYTEALQDIVKKSFNCRGKWSRLYFREIQATAEQRSRACYEAVKEE